MTSRLLTLSLLALALPASAQPALPPAALPLVQTAADAAPARGAIVFAYFKEPADQGIYLALSYDGYTFTPLNDGQPWIKPQVPGELMRDIFITREPSGHGFRAVWTWAWRGSTLGTASSPDLMTWSVPTEVPIMQDYPGTRNTWAPETYWDAKSKDWILFWSSAVDNVTHGHSIFAAHTSDWIHFSKPQVFFGPGYDVIDQTFFHRHLNGRSDVLFVFKDQTADPLRYSVRWASGPTVKGPWSAPSGPINQSWSEGPSVIEVNGRFIVYYDHYRPPGARYEGVETTDWIHWTSVNDKMHFPEACKHGSFLRVSASEAKQLLARHDSPSN